MLSRRERQARILALPIEAPSMSRIICSPLPPMNTLFRILVAGSALAFASCSSSKPKGVSTKSLPKVSGSASGASSARPVNHLSRSEYPFDAAGNYITSWASSGTSSSSYSKPRVSKKTYSTASKPKAKPTPKYRPPAKKSVPRYHVVRKGDTLYGLSRRYGKSISALQKANGIRGNGIRLGQRLRIP